MPRALRQNFLQKIVVVRRKSSQNLPGKELEHRHRARAVADQAMQQLRVNSMTQHSSPAPGSKGESTVKVSRSHEGRRDRRNKTRLDARPKKRIELASNARLLARSEEMLKGLLDKYGTETIGDDLFRAVLNAKLGERFRRMQRAHRRKVLAAGSALYHIIARRIDPETALQTLVKRMNVIPPRGSDWCRTIVECLFDYGSTTDERTRNRQYACSDANALRYIVRKGIEPQKVLAPEAGESITKWAKREAIYRRPEKALHAHPHKAEAGNSTTSESAEQELPVMPSSQVLYRVLQKWTKKGLFLVDPKGNGCPLAVIVTPLGRLTADQAKSRPAKVRAVIREALDKIALPPSKSLT